MFNSILSGSHFWPLSYFCSYWLWNAFSNNSSTGRCSVLAVPQPASSRNGEKSTFLSSSYPALMWIEDRMTICYIWLACIAVMYADDTSVEPTCQMKISLNRWDIGSLGFFDRYKNFHIGCQMTIKFSINWFDPNSKRKNHHYKRKGCLALADNPSTIPGQGEKPNLSDKCNLKFLTRISFYGADTSPYLLHKKNTLGGVSPMYLQCPWPINCYKTISDME